MLYSAFAGITVFFAFITFYMGVRLTGRAGWLISWLRGTAALMMMALCVLFVLAAIDLFSYKQVLNNRVLGSVSFKKLEDQHYMATLVFLRDGREQQFDLRGDQWQVDARLITWSDFLTMLGAKPGYRLDRLSGRYYSLEDEHRRPRTVHQLSSSEYGMDIWHLAQQTGNHLPMMDAVYGSATYLPMADGALYEISLSSSGLVAKPLNDVANRAVSRWN
ncbi:cation/multidrug efflux pump [Teredinibacter turnerae T7901]|uniref:Cation/multidrug efflux pump n=1 Tax=Teredinibacter turnerae (strain ATCC 39867 / T7901) TaxID=377629 RepID=C5BJB1_TERTT|nr:hypothetical protein [Teredinibacter turnerae]ACR13828.1 cation/multidrug efflux pump [Teredinibacter turnerae T7901]